MAFQHQAVLWLFFLCFHSLLRPVSSTYLVLPNADNHYGPDGPWNAFTINVGTPAQSIDVYLGGSFGSAIIAAEICNNSDGTPKTSCPARDVGGGVYNQSLSRTSNTDEIQLTGSGANNLGYDGGKLLGITGDTAVMMDRMLLGDGPLLEQTVTNVSINRIDSAIQTLPGGETYDLQVGFISMGAPNINQTFTWGGSRPNTNATIPVNQLAVQGSTDSRTWGMHIGSAMLNQPGSLIFGGYDRSRVASDPAVFDIKNGGDMEVILQSIKFGVMKGESPWGVTPEGNMLIVDNTATSSASDPQVTVRLSAVPPYLYLPQNTCNEIAKHLPVFLDASWGLYIWNTTDPRFSLIVNSTGYIEFGFSYRSGEYPIKIPMKLLALELESPFPVRQTTSYFPCRPTTSTTTSPSYYLGRAFLQGAFLGLSWGPNKFWLAQAPGPSMESSDIYDIGPDDVTITAMPNVDWASSWTSVLTVNTTGTTSGASSTPSGSNATTNSDIDSQSTGGLSTGGKAGIAVGVVGVLLGVGALVFVVRRKKQKPAVADGPPIELPPKQPPAQELPAQTEYVEADNYLYYPASPPVQYDSGHFTNHPHQYKQGSSVL